MNRFSKDLKTASDHGMMKGARA
jgi:hypothetical protein